jgi:inner membrane protein
MDFELRWDVSAWAIVALLLFGMEVLAPGAFMLWLAFAASAVMVIVWLFPGLSFLIQAMLFVALGFASILVYRKWFRGNDDVMTDQPALNRRAAQLVGRRCLLGGQRPRSPGRRQRAHCRRRGHDPDSRSRGMTPPWRRPPSTA